MNIKKKSICIIPARGGSKGIPRKNIVGFCGKPLILWTILQALQSKKVTETYVTSDNDEILEIALKAGAKTIERPEELAKDNSSSEEALVHALPILEQQQGQIDAVVFLQATSPIRESQDIDKSLDVFFSNNLDSLFSGSIIDDLCLWKKNDEKFNSFTYDYKERGRRQTREPYYLENGSMYIFKPEVLKQSGNRLGGKIGFYQMPTWKSYEIDDMESLKICRYFMKKNIIDKQRGEQ